VTKGKVAVLVESHFDEVEYREFNEFFPANGYEVVYVSHLWGQDSLTFLGNDGIETVTVTTEVENIRPTDYDGVILIGGYAMDRLRYQDQIPFDSPNEAPAVRFLRDAVTAMDEVGLPVGGICHSLWLFCADPALLKGRKVTCAHNILGDVVNAGGEIVFGEDRRAVDTFVDGSLVTGRHPGVVDEFVARFLAEVVRRRSPVG
jgi:putative intracellular protease/amidase